MSQGPAVFTDSLFVFSIIQGPVKPNLLPNVKEVDFRKKSFSSDTINETESWYQFLILKPGFCHTLTVGHLFKFCFENPKT